MSIQLFQSLRGDLFATSKGFAHRRVRSAACQPIACASDFLVWFRVFFQLRQKRSTKSHETARTKSVQLRVISWIVLSGKRQTLKIGHLLPAQSKARFGRHSVVALGWVAVLICLTSIAGAQQARVEIRVLPDPAGRVIVEGSCAPATAWSFRDSYAGVLNLGTRIEGLRLFDAKGSEISNRRIAPGQFQAAAPATRFRYAANLAGSGQTADASRVSWLSSERGLLMLRDLLPACATGTAANSQGMTVRL